MPTPTSYAVQSPMKTLAKDARGEELIDKNTRLGNSHLIYEIFHINDAAIYHLSIAPLLV
jgi:hypothetical protein